MCRLPGGDVYLDFLKAFTVAAHDPQIHVLSRLGFLKLYDQSRHMENIIFSESCNDIALLDAGRHGRGIFLDMCDPDADRYIVCLADLFGDFNAAHSQKGLGAA